MEYQGGFNEESELNRVIVSQSGIAIGLVCLSDEAEDGDCGGDSKS